MSKEESTQEIELDALRDSPDARHAKPRGHGSGDAPISDRETARVAIDPRDFDPEVRGGHGRRDAPSSITRTHASARALSITRDSVPVIVEEEDDEGDL